MCSILCRGAKLQDFAAMITIAHAHMVSLMHMPYWFHLFKSHQMISVNLYDHPLESIVCIGTTLLLVLPPLDTRTLASKHR